MSPPTPTHLRAGVPLSTSQLQAGTCITATNNPNPTDIPIHDLKTALPPLLQTVQPRSHVLHQIKKKRRISHPRTTNRLARNRNNNASQPDPLLHHGDSLLAVAMLASVSFLQLLRHQNIFTHNRTHVYVDFKF